MAGYHNVGTIDAKITLNTKEFEEAISKLKGDVNSIKESFNQKTNGSNGLLNDVKDLKKEIESLQEKTKNYQSTIKTLREENTNYAKTVKELQTQLKNVKKSQAEFSKGLKDEQVALENNVKSAKKYVRTLKDLKTSHNNQYLKYRPAGERGKRGDIFNITQGGGSFLGVRGKYGDFSYWTKMMNTGKAAVSSIKREFDTLTEAEVKQQSILEGMKTAYTVYTQEVNRTAEQERLSWLTRQSVMRNALETFVSGTRQMVIEQRKAFGSSGGYNNYLQTLSKVRREFGEVSTAAQKELPKVMNIFKQLEGSVKKLYAYSINKEGELVNPQLIGRSVEALKKLDFQVLETARNMKSLGKAVPNFAGFEERITQLGSRIHKLAVQGTSNWEGRQSVGGYSNYLQQITNIERKQREETQRLRIATGELGTAYKNNIQNLNTYKANITQINKTLEQQRLRTAQLEAAQSSLYYKNAPNNLNTYKMNIDKITQAVDRQTKSQNKSNESVKTGQKSMREFGTSMGKSEAYANNLYRGLQKVRSVIISVKTIASSLGTMAAWNFAFDLIDKAKETYNAKNEMEQLLVKNSRVNANGVTVFNKALDETVERFQKINKYSLGETAASIGLEFNLNGKEMAESLDVISMIQSEYVRAGRTTEEAALAVKDILQGEFMRLSRETGVGKEELIGYGWNGNNKDVKSLMAALKKAALDRHWDLFAEKATSVQDVITITQSRFSEFGAELISNIEPVIVNGFNGLIDILDSVKTGFNNLTGFEQVLTVGLGGSGAFVGITSAIMMLKKNIGLVDIATMGWSKSLATAITGLKRTDVVTHGFWRTLVATVSGTDVATTANMRFTKILAGRIFGVNQAVQAEQGFFGALVHSKMALKGVTLDAKAGSVIMGNLRQKIIYLAKGEIVADKASATWGKTLKSLVTSTRLLRIALIGLASIGIITWLAGIAEQCRTTKKQVDGFHNIVNNGADKLAEAKGNVEAYENTLANLDKTTDKYKRTQANLDIAEGTVQDLEDATELAKQYDYQIKQYGKSITDRKKSRMVESLQIAGYDYSAATRKASNYADTVERGYQAEIRAYVEEDKRLYSASQHINERLSLMKKEDESRAKQITDEKERTKFEKESLKQRVNYAQEYAEAASETAEHWKQFYKGDFQQGFYAILGEFRLAWIDLWNDDHFRHFWDSINKTWKELLPSLKSLWSYIVDIGHGLMDFFSTDSGRWIGTIGAIGTGIGIIGLKLAKWVTGDKSVFGVLKKVSGKVKDLAKNWKGVSDNAEEATEKMGGSTSTGGIAGDTGKATLGEELKGIGKNRLKSFVNNALIIAEGMGLVTEAILLMRLPMFALANVGEQFKTDEPQIRKGIEGLQLVAPVVGAVLVPIVILHQVLSRYGKFMDTREDLISNLKAMATLMLGILEGMVLVTEAIYLLKAPMWALAEVGKDFSNSKGNINQGVEALKTVSSSLLYLAPFIPVFAAGVIMTYTLFSNFILGASLYAAAIIGIPAGMLLLAEGIRSLQYPLGQISEIGRQYEELGNVKTGAEAIKNTAEALGYVAEAMGYMAMVDFTLLADNVAQIVAGWFGIDLTGDLTKLTEENGFFDQINKFTKEFNKLTIEVPDPDKVTSLASAGDGIKTIGDAMFKVKTAMDNLPEEFKNKQNTGEQLGITGNNTDGTATNTTTDVTSYFDQFKEPLRQLKSFIYDFNNSEDYNFEPIDTDRVANVSKAADMITTVNDAVTKVKTTMQGISDSQWATAQAEGGIFGAIGNFLYHQTGAGSINNGQASGDYKSSLGSQLKEMEDVVSDIFTFQSNINSMTSNSGGENDNVDGATAMVTTIQDAISKLAQSLSDAVPTFEGKGNAISQAVVTGINEGLKGLPDISSKIANKIMNSKETLYATATSLGKTSVTKFKEGINPMDEVTGWELYYVNQKFTGEWYDKIGTSAYNLGVHAADKYQLGLDMHSPGKMARDTEAEVGYIGDALSVNNLPQMAYDLANSLSSNFKLDFGLNNLKLPDVSQLLQGFNTIPTTVSDIKTKVSTDFTNLQTGLSTNFNNITSKTRSSMSNMLSLTTRNITGIKTSWRGMQDALIASAENIKTKTSSKISKLKTNLGDFWNKIKHPDQLISGSAGGHTGSIRRRFGSVPKGNYAGGIISRSQSLFKPKGGKGSPSDLADDYLKCLIETGKPCFAGSWQFNWNRPISRKFKGWNTHFNKYSLDKFLNVGKFENSNFPVKGRADVAKQYIFDVIRATRYGKYFNSKFGDDPVAALRAGVFNCWDGTNIILAIARAFGFEGSQQHGTWNGIGHVWANIPGLGIIDPTAIQQRGTFTSSAVRGYSAGSIRRGKADLPEMGETHNYNGDVNIHIHTDGSNVKVDNRRIDQRSARQILDIIGINPATGN